MLDLIINHAILHVIGRGGSVYSDHELDVDSDACSAFITKNVRRVMTDKRSKEATFNADSAALAIINDYMADNIDFREFSRRIGALLEGVIGGMNGVEPADLLVVQFDKKDDGYIAILKINYKECVTHHITVDEESEHANAQIMNVPSLDSGKVEAACVIPYSPMLLNVLETPVESDGEEICYFSDRFLQCGTQMSKKTAVDIINNAVTEVNALYFNESPAMETKIKTAVVEEAADNEGAVSVQNVAAKVFGDNEEARKEFVDLAKDAGLVADAVIGEKYAKSQFSAIKFKADNGVEIKIPTDVAADSTQVEFDEHPDGTVTISVMNLRRA